MYFKSFTILWRNVENNRFFSFNFNHEKWSQTVKRLGFSPATIGIREKSDKDDEKVINGECEIVFRTLESWLPKSWMKELKERKLGWQTQETFLDSHLGILWDFFPLLWKTWDRKFLAWENIGRLMPRMITQMGFFWEKGSTLLCIPGLGNLVNAFPCYSQSWKYLGDYILMLFTILWIIWEYSPLLSPYSE